MNSMTSITQTSPSSVLSAGDGPVGYSISLLQSSDENEVADLIRRNMQPFSEAGGVLATTYRRLEKLATLYAMPGSRFLIARSQANGRCIAAIGIGPLAGLPPEEGVGEIRDMVVDAPYRGQGLGRILLEQSLTTAKEFGYNRIYLETTPQMEKAQKLFASYGFKPVVQKSKDGRVNSPEEAATFPCYFLLQIKGE